ncbi:MAG: hypothetical protein SGARI_003837, partial [Bacillariaceae sp.]
MEGRAFGAPIFRVTPNNSNNSDDVSNVLRHLDSSLTLSSASGAGLMVEAMPVEEEKVVYADSSPLSIKYLIQRGSPIREFVIAGIVLLAIAIGIICYFVLSKSGGSSSDDSTPAPLASPTF